MKNSLVFNNFICPLKIVCIFLAITFFTTPIIEGADIFENRAIIDNNNSQEKQKVAIWIRQWLGSEKDLAAATDYLNSLIEELGQNPSIEPIIMIITKPNNPMLTIQLDGIDKNNVHILISNNFDSFSDPLNTLIQETPAGIPVLTISPGIKMASSNSLAGFNNLVTEGLANIFKSEDRKEEAENSEQKRVYAYGWEIDYGDFDQPRHFAACLKGQNWCHAWKIPSYRNDGSTLGKGWYNTCALLAPRFIAQLKKDPIPEYVDTGKIGILDILNGSTGTLEAVLTGGVEELVMMGAAVKVDPNAICILDTRTPLLAGAQTGTGVPYQAKLTRKVIMGFLYGNILNPENPEYLQNHLLVIKPEKESPADLKLEKKESVAPEF